MILYGTGFHKGIPKHNSPNSMTGDAYYDGYLKGWQATAAIDGQSSLDLLVELHLVLFH